MKLLSASMIAAVLVAGATSVRAEDTEAVVPLLQGSYFALAGGLNATTDGNALDLNRVPQAIKFKFHEGPAISVSGGYKLGIGLRTELEGSYRTNGVKDFDLNTNPLTGHQSDISFMANMLYDINTGTRVTPYLGAGIGVSMVSWKKFANASSAQIINSGSSSTKFAIQAIGGFAVAIAPQWETTVDFRYKGSNGHSFAGVQAVDSITGYKLRDMTIMVGLRYAFDTQTRATAVR
ncbi:MAG: P44/Msp2 family outer membrane protein [Rhodospirillaceae bacterium]|nr:MAG: P44/Msp2 family outer membrane protein [Rhodospirillaceae bacterium]